MQSATGAVIAADNLSRAFGSRRAVDDVTLRVGRGESLVVFGPNGAGKTTLLRMLGGLLRPTSGKAAIGGVALPGGPSVRRKVGIVSHHSLLYEALTARENVAFAAKLYGVSDHAARTERALERMRILDRAETPVRALSRGLRQRVSVARATVHDPSVVLADEPFTGLDVAGAGALSAVLDELRATGACLVLVTHNIDEGLALASHVAVMNGGRMVMSVERGQVEPAEFAQRYQQLVGPNV